MTSDAESTPGNPPPPDKSNVFSRIAGVLFAPAETFAAIARRPDIVGPLLVIIIVGYIGTAVIMPKFDYEALHSAQADEMRKRDPNVGEQQLAQVRRVTTAVTKVGGWSSPIIAVALYALIAGVLLLAFRLFGGDGTYKQAFSATLYAWMPMVLLGIVSTIIVFAQGTFNPVTAPTLVKSNPAFLVDMTEQPVLFALLASIELFSIWRLVLLTYGFAAVSRVSKAKAATIVFGLWLALTFVRVGIAALTASRT
jgi:hypothetical protein